MSWHYEMSLIHSATGRLYLPMAASLCLYGWELFHEEHLLGMVECGGGMELGFHEIVTYQY